MAKRLMIQKSTEAREMAKKITNVSDLRDFRNSYNLHTSCKKAFFDTISKDLLEAAEALFPNQPKKSSIAKPAAASVELTIDDAKKIVVKFAKQYGISSDDIEVKTILCDIDDLIKRVNAELELQVFRTIGADKLLDIANFLKKEEETKKAAEAAPVAPEVKKGKAKK